MKALLIDDHPLILAGLQIVIQGFGANVSVVCAETARGARELLAENASYDIVLLDLQLGDCSGFELLEELRVAYPSLSVVVVSSSDSNDDVSRAIYLGAMGFIPKRASNEVLFEALSMVMSGGIYVPPMGLRSTCRRPLERKTMVGVFGPRPARALTRRTRGAPRLRSASRRGRRMCWNCCCRGSRTSSSRARSTSRSKRSRITWRRCFEP